MPDRRFIPIPQADRSASRYSGGIDPGRLVAVDPPGPAFQFPWPPAWIVPQGGHGRWAVVDHDRWKQSTEFSGTDLTRHTLQLMFDAQLQGVADLDYEWRTLNDFAMPVGHWPSGKEPPVLSFLPYGGTLRWVVESLDWDTATAWRHPQTGKPVHLECTLTLLEHRVPKLAVTPVERAQPAAATPAATKQRTVRSGEWLSKIAKEEYGDASMWTLIYTANPHIGANPDLIQPGQVLTIPPRP